MLVARTVRLVAETNRLRSLGDVGEAERQILTCFAGGARSLHYDEIETLRALRRRRENIYADERS